MSRTDEVTTLAGGCFWCLEAVFEQLQGVLQVVSGYSGGRMPNPSYEQVCGGDTGHAEVVQLHFNPEVVSFQELLGVFLSIHDPTTLNRQGPDVGSQYRSAIFYHSPEQKTVAEQVIREIGRSGTWAQPIVTEITPVEPFYPAEEHHQEYYRRNPDQAYCQFIIEPKVAKFRKEYLARLRTEPAGTSAESS
ncbi:MAG: peptide-methionine (S)-S-oxide reductase MsrA [Chloroflexi bacterium]|nr:peptide-methionine (S)-S-oxide reductase MsrA [Chloroflexota bacterium]